MTGRTEWILWGQGPALRIPDLPIRLTGGTLAHCRRERDRNYRPAKLPDRSLLWSDLGIYAQGIRPPFGRTLAELSPADRARLAGA